MTEQKLESMAKSLKSISHPQRLKILMLLGCSKKLTVSDIQKSVGLTQSMTSQHLLSMKRENVLTSSKDENRVYYSIINQNVLKVISCMKNCAEKNN